MQWAVEEQTIPVTSVKTPVQSIVLRVDPSNTALCLLELHCAPDAEHYVLRFDRNGALNAVATIAAPETPPVAEATAAHATPDTHKGKK